MGVLDDLFGGGAERESRRQADEARRREDARAAEIRRSTEYINRLFSGGDIATGPATAYQPGTTYYDSLGNVWTPVTIPSVPPSTRSGVFAVFPTPEQQAQTSIAQGRLFTGTKKTPGFDDDYYRSISDAYENYYLPQVEEQGRRARRSIAFNPAGGASGSSAYARQLGEFERDYELERQGVRSGAMDAVNRKRSQIEGTRASLLSAAQGGEDFSSLANRSAAQIRSASAPEPYAPIADLFQRYTAAAANARLADDAGYRPVKPLLFGPSRTAQRTIQ